MTIIFQAAFSRNKGPKENNDVKITFGSLHKIFSFASFSDYLPVFDGQNVGPI